MIGKKRIAGLLLATAVAASAIPAAAATGTVSGSVTCSGKESSKVTLSLVFRGGAQAIRTVKQTGNKGGFTMDGLADGLYTLKASKAGHAPREYPVVLVGGSVTQDVKLCQYGDVSGDGRISVNDTATIYSHVRGVKAMEDAYILQCADFDQSGRINVGDAVKIYSGIRNPQPEVTVPQLPADPVEDNKDTPVEIGSTLNFVAGVEAKHLAYYNLYRVSGTSLVINSPYAYAVYNGVTYEAEDGVLTVPGLQSDSMNVPVSIAIGNRGDEDQAFQVSLVYPQGHQMNPLALNTGMLSTYCPEGDSQGVYYTYTASKDGKLVIRLSGSTDCNITITSDTVEGGTRCVSLSDNPDSNSVTFEMTEGESVTVCVVMNPVNGFNYPEAFVSSTVQFR